MTGIYKILNLANEKCYIGQAENIDKRTNKHFSLLRKNQHYNIYLQNAWNKYGEYNFQLQIIEECIEKELNKREVNWINFFDSFNNGYNQTLGGDGLKGYKHSKEAKQKISEASKNFKMTEEHKRKLINSITGRKKSEKELEKLSKAAKDRKISDWHKQQLVNSTKDKPLSVSHRQKISNARKGFKMSEEQKIKLSEINKGKPSANKKINDEQRKLIIDLFIENPYISIAELAKKYNVGISTIYGLRREANVKPERIVNEKQRQEISKKLKGRKLSDEHKRNISLASKSKE